MSPMEEELSKIQREFYSSQSKRMFLTKTQKKECAEYIAQKMSLEELMQNTVYVIKNTNYVLIDYPVFKQYMISAHYASFIQYVLHTINKVIEEYGTYEMHINLSSFSVSAVEKYYVMIHTFYDICCQPKNELIVGRLSNIHIYHTPIMIHVIKTMLSKLNVESINGKTHFYTKDESPELLKRLMTQTSGKRATRNVSLLTANSGRLTK
jgi:hypothetical protein